MKKTQGIDADELNLVKLAQEYSDEDKARELFESWRWPNGKPICPHCKFNEAYKIISKRTTKKANKARAGLYCCAACRKTFTATVGTAFEDSRLPISKWLMAIFIICSSKKAVSALQLSRMLGVTYKTAWFMAHRIRFSMADDGKTKLSGVVEIDETFIGGVGDPKTKLSRLTPVMALIEQGGNMKAKVVAGVSYKNLGKVLFESVNKDAVVCSDENKVWQKNVENNFKAHHRVNHSEYEYILRTPDGISAGTNHCESFFSLLKRGVHGAWHNVSREHLPKYVNEFAFRWNTRKQSDGQRMVNFMPMIEGKRLMYRRPKN
jgi:transposase-like protein